MTNDCQSDFLFTAKYLNSWKYDVLVFTLLFLYVIVYYMPLCFWCGGTETDLLRLVR